MPHNLRALIIVPKRDTHAAMFYQVAQAVKEKVYGKNAVIERVHGPNFDVFGCFHLVDTVITISHGGPLDGPFMDDRGNEQPWSFRNHDGYVGKGKTFWFSMGQRIRTSGKIILIGCEMASRNYSDQVAFHANRATYASRYSFAAANAKTTVRHVTAIENFTPLKPMRKSVYLFDHKFPL